MRVSLMVRMSLGLQLSLQAGMQNDAHLQVKRPCADVECACCMQIWALLFQRLQGSKTAKFSRAFVVFLAFFIAQQGAAQVATSIDTVQAGLFNILMQNIWLPSMTHVVGQHEEKLVSVATTKVGQCCTSCTYFGQPLLLLLVHGRGQSRGPWSMGGCCCCTLIISFLPFCNEIKADLILYEASSRSGSVEGRSCNATTVMPLINFLPLQGMQSVEQCMDVQHLHRARASSAHKTVSALAQPTSHTPRHATCCCRCCASARPCSSSRSCGGRC